MAIRTLVASLVIGAAAASAHAQGGTWTAKAPCPNAITGHAVAAVGGYLYQYGGYSTVSPAPAWRYDPSTDSWTPRAPLPVTSLFLTGASYGRFCFAFGSSTAPDAIYVYNTTIDSWSTLTATLSVGRTMTAVATLDTRIYICGGYSASGFSDVVDELNVTTGVVTPKAALPMPCRGALATVVGSRLYVMGGSNAALYLNACSEYDSALDQWTPRAPLPQSRIWFGVFAINSRIFAVGGTTTTGHSTLVTEYHPAVDEWTARTSLPTARVYAAGCVVSGKAFIVGGQGTALLPDCLEFTPPAYGTPPADPTALWMQQPGGPHLAEGAWLNTTTMEFGATLTDADAGDTLRIEVEAGTFSGTGPAAVTIPGMTEGPYTWRCRSRDLIGNVNPAGWVYFDTSAVDFNLDHTAPTGVTPLYPVNVDLFAPTAAGAVVDFGWLPATDNGPSVTYDLEVSLYSNFSTLAASATGITATTAQTSLPINFGGGSYFWRVRAVDQSGNPATSWGFINSFHLWFEDGINHAGGDGLFSCSAGPRISSPILLLGLALLLALTSRR